MYEKKNCSDIYKKKRWKTISIEKETELIWLILFKTWFNTQSLKKLMQQQSSTLIIWVFPLSVYLFYSSTMGHIKFDKIPAMWTVF